MSKTNLAKTLNDAVALHQRGDFAKAEALYRAVLQKDPRNFDALHLLGLLAEQAGNRPSGIALIREAVKVQPAAADALCNLARMVYAEGDMAEAERLLTHAISLKPGLAHAHNMLGNLYRRRGAYGDAAAAFERAIRHAPKVIEPYINLCNTYRDSCDEAKMIDVADRGLRIAPENAMLQILRAEAAFTTGRLAEGWRDYNGRFPASNRTPDAQGYGLPLWQGESLAGKSIVIWSEQGVGDEMIYAGMIAGIAATARRCVLQTTSRLAPLFARSFPNVEIFSDRLPTDVVRTLDVQVAMGSMGQWRRPTFSSFPAATDYLKADPGKTAALRAKYLAGGKTLLVGLSWRSAGAFNGTAVGNAAEKTIGLNQWGAILSIPGVTFVNLQYGDARAEIAGAREAFKANIIEDASIDNIADLDGFAAQVGAMDLVISSSNTAAHIAGALGVPTWCMVPRALTSGRRWYWFGDGAYAPWYRAITLFRQTGPGWMNVLADIALSLVTAAAKHGVLTDPGRYLDSLARGYASAGLVQESGKTRLHAAALSPTPPRLMEAADVYMRNGDLSAALDTIGRVTQMPDAPAESHNTHGRILAKLDRQDDAIAHYRQALARQPSAAILNNLGTSLRRIGRSAEALPCYAEASRLQPDHPSILLNHASALAENNHTDEALAVFGRLITLHPDFADGHYNRATTLLNTGRFQEGWKAFNWRLRRANVHVSHKDFPHPVWSGENLADKHILIWTDLGIGDEVLTASVVPDAIQSAQRVTLLCSARLVSLFRRSFPKAIVDVRASPLPATALSKDIDLQMSIAELGAAFRASRESFPTQGTLLTPDTALRDRLRHKYLAGRENTRLVGLSWRSVHPEVGRQKSLPLAQWLPILKTPAITFVNLQYGDCRAELDALQRDHGITVINDPDIDFFGDIDPVAAQVAAMDMVVSVSNTAVHLAGGLGVPTWAMVPPGQGRLWYWFREGERCDWYPSVTLHTPQGDDGWTDLITNIGHDLNQWAAQHRG